MCVSGELLFDAGDADMACCQEALTYWRARLTG
jgi:hypothetical protein